MLAVCLLLLSLSAWGSDVRFEVVSIRPMSGPAATNTNPSANGFDSRLSLWQMIMVAYGPANPVNWGSVEVVKGPSWIADFYDIKARVSQADLTAWQKQGPEHELLRSAMRAALKDRCKLVIHEQPSKAEVFELVIAKAGSRLKAAGSATAPPTAVMVPTVEGGKQVKTFHGATMQDLVDFLSIMSGRTPVRDKTGLMGRYDFRIQQVPFEPDVNHVYSYPVQHLGLEVRRGTENRPALVIDHIERPTAN